MSRSFVSGALVAAAVLWSAAAARAQDSVTVAPGAEYRASAFKRLFLGSNWRDLWTTPVRVQVLDLDRFAGGLEPVREGGGMQSRTLHFLGADGRRYIFRSINKYALRGLPGDVQRTPAGALVQDQVSALHPFNAAPVPRMLEALGILHVAPVLRVMPDDPRLGELRDFAGMLGWIEPQPDEGPDDEPLFFGSEKIKGTDNFYDDLNDEHGHRLDAREFLRARLFDFVIGDTDRGSDQWKFARYGQEGAYSWRPIPRDRDWAFMRPDSWLIGMAVAAYEKFVPWTPAYPSIEAQTYSSHLLDRRLLASLTREDFMAEADIVRERLTDEVIAAAVRDLPPELVPGNAERLAATLRVRRNNIGGPALAFYDWLASAVDVRGTDERDRVEVTRRDDGTVHVALYAIAAPVATNSGNGDPYYERLFRPEETREIRVYLHDDDDVGIVRGSGPSRIMIRIIGGGGADQLLDRTSGHHVRFYDDEGVNDIELAPQTTFSADAYRPPAPTEGLRAGSGWAPDYGRDSGWSPAFDYREGAGVIIGYGPGRLQYGFRRLPYKFDIGARALYGTRSGGFGVDALADYRFENSANALRLHARATQFESTRFFGYGNDTPDSAAATLVLRDEIVVHPAFVHHFGWRTEFRPADDDNSDPGDKVPEQLEDDEEEEEEEEPEAAAAPAAGEDRSRLRPLDGELSFGPVLRWTDPRPAPTSPLAATPVAGARGTFELGAQAALSLWRTDRPAAPRRGFSVNSNVAWYPFAQDLGAEPATAPELPPGAPATTGSFTALRSDVAAYVPLLGEGPHLALRVGGARIFGDFPVHHAAFLGGKATLRGYEYQRFAGDAAVHGSAELRVPVDSVKILSRGELGVFGLADVGRVYLDGRAPGGWQSGFGGGIWFATLGRAASLAYARGEGNHIYVKLGLPF